MTIEDERYTGWVGAVIGCMAVEAIVLVLVVVIYHVVSS